MRYPLEKEYPITDDFEAHVKRGSKATGVDLACPSGTPVLAVADGFVTSWGYSEIGGQYVWIRHHLGGNKWASSYYCHLSSVLTMIHQYMTVWAGQPIGLSGSTGHSTGPHLHCSIKVGGRWVDPETLWKGDGNV